jgi:N utilization substance protein A
LGEEAAGQSGDLQGLSRAEDSNAESVEELLEEGQAFEAEVIRGVENAPDADEEEIHTHERQEDELPPEEP